MNPNELRILIRVLMKDKVLTTINILGLAFGIASCFLIILFVADEAAFDAHNKNLDRIFQITTVVTTDGAVDHAALSSTPLVEVLNSSYSEVEVADQFTPLYSVTIQSGHDFFSERNIYRSGNGVFRIFTFDFIEGDPENPLALPRQMVVTKTFSTKYFGNESPLNKTLLIDGDEYLITALIDDVPANSDFKFDALVSHEGPKADEWFDFGSYTFLLAKGNSGGKEFVERFESELNELAEEKYNKALKASNQSTRITFDVQSLDGLHFRKPLVGDTPKGDKNYLYIFSFVALFLLIVSSLNYVNFSIAQSMERTLEVGIRKAVGASFSHLVIKYLSESVFVAFLAGVLGLGTAALVLGPFNEMSGKDFTLFDLLDFKTMVFFVGIVLFIGLVAGSFPALYVSRVKAVNALKGKVAGVKGNSVRKVSIVVQFAISIGFIICTLITYQQLTFIKEFDKGFTSNNVVVIETPADTTDFRRVKSLQERVQKLSTVKSVSVAGDGALPGQEATHGTIRLKTDGDAKMVNFAWIDEQYLPTLGIKLSKGRNFELSHGTDPTSTVIINDVFARRWAWKDPLQETVLSGETDLSVIGVVSGFHHQSLYNSIEPLIFFFHDKRAVSLIVSIENGADVKASVEAMEAEWFKIFSDKPFIYSHLNESLYRQYEKDQTTMDLFAIFSLLTIIISSSGLYGLSSLTVYQRKKEIGMRKILGASLFSIIYKFSKEYLLLVLVSFCIICPVSWYFMDKWLTNFSYHTGIGFVTFSVVGLTTALLTIAIIALSLTKMLMASLTSLVKES